MVQSLALDTKGIGKSKWSCPFVGMSRGMRTVWDSPH